MGSKTIYTCDRCGAQLIALWFRKIHLTSVRAWHWKNKDWSLELCDDCMDKVMKVVTEKVDV